MVTSTQPIRTQYSYALYSTSSSDGGFICREIVLYIEHTNKAFNKEKTKALLVYFISSILELDGRPLGLLSNSLDSISHSAHVIIPLYPILHSCVDSL